MANTWPIVRTQRTMPTPGIRSGGSINIDFSTGQADVWRQVGNLAATGMDAATKLYLKQAEDQYATAQIQSMQDETGYAESLRKEMDETKYDTMLDSHIASQDKLRPKNPLAAKEWDMYVAKRSVSLKKSNEEAKNERLYDKWQTRRDLLTEQGNIPLLRQETAAGIALGYDESEAMEYLRKAEHKVQRRTVEDIVLGDNPRQFDKYKTAESLIKDYPVLVPGDFVDLRQLQQSQIRNLEKNQLLSSEMAEAKISNDIIKGKKTPQEILTDIENLADKGSLDGTQIRQLKNFLDNQMSKAGKSASQIEMGDAKNSIYNAIESGKKDEATKLWRENAWMFTESRNDEILKDIRDIGEKTTDTILTDGLLAEGRFTADYKKTRDIAGSIPEQLATIETESVKRREQIRQAFRDKPDMTPNQKLETIQGILAPVKEELAKEVVKRGLWSRFFAKTEAAYTAGLKPYMKKSQYKIGDTISKSGRKWKVVGFDNEEPLVEESK